MKKNHKIKIIVSILLAMVVGIILFLNNYLKKEIENALGKEYKSSELSYYDISINAFGGKAVIRNLRIKEGIFSLEAEEVNLDGFSYADYLKNDNITIGNVNLINPIVTFNKSDSIPGDNDSEDVVREKRIRVKRFSASGGNIRMIENDSAPDSFYASLKDLLIKDIVIEKKSEGSLLPFTYESVSIGSDSLYYDLNDNHYIQSKDFRLRNDDLGINDFSIIPKFSKQVFDSRIPYEQDWIALKVSGVNLKGLKWEKKEERTMISVALTDINKAHLEIYRNKLLPDDTRIKPMYSEMLRKLGFLLDINEVKISNSYIEYQEKVLESRPPAKLSFHNVQAEIDNITNHNPDAEDFPLTKVKAKALFMGKTDLSLNWDFDVSNEMDEFRINGKLGSLQAENINSFLIPSMNVEAQGNIQSLYYDFSGNRNQANGNMHLAYKDFNVKILKDGKAESKSLFSKLANLIIKNDRINEDVKQENINTTRDKTKSFWNFLWLCIRDGALSTFF